MNCVFVFSFHRLFSFLWLIHMIPKRPFHSLWISKSLPRLHFMAPAATLSLLIPNVIHQISPESGMKLHKFPGKLYIKICGGTPLHQKRFPRAPSENRLGRRRFLFYRQCAPGQVKKYGGTILCGQEWFPRAPSKKAIGNDIGFELSGNLSISF